MLHSSQLPDGNRTSDRTLAELADTEGRVMVTKDRDFETSHLLHGQPARLLLITTGNVSNNSLLELVGQHLGAIEAALGTNTYVELSHAAMVIHGRETG